MPAGVIQKLRVQEEGVGFRESQRSFKRWLNKRIYKKEMKFWAVLGSRDCRVKKTPNCHK
jgi:hypothetical protein